MPRQRIQLPILILAILILVPALGAAQDIEPGHDLFQTDPDTTWDHMMIPADFLDPGSDPFDSTVPLQGNPPVDLPACPNDDLSQTDTIVRRLTTAPVANPGDQATIDIEIVALDLVGIQPITVTYNGGQDPEEWSIRVDLDAIAPQPPGTMTITRVDGLGGTFDSMLPVIPRLTFTRDSDGAVRQINGSEFALTLAFEALGVPWRDHTPPDDSCTSNFCVNPDEVTVEDALLAAHGVISICPDPGTATARSAWSTVKSLF